MSDIIDMTKKLPHRAHHVACMECAHDWRAAVPVRRAWPIECPECGEMSGEKVVFTSIEWFERFMVGKNYLKRMMFLVKAKRKEPPNA